MNCRTSQYELSQCLDGRLPSGRRSLVMAHVADCQPCARFWAELQRAQELVLRLPRQQVSRGFREALWERIEAGEGTPAAILQESVPLATKARYVLTGAAAAALLVVAVRIAGGQPAPPNTTELARKEQPETHAAALHGEVAQTEPAPPRPLPPHADALAGALLPTAGPMAAFERLTPGLMAREAATQFRESFSTASWYANRLARQRPDGEPAQRRSGDITDIQQAAQTLFQRAHEVRRLGTVLLDMKDQGHVGFRDDRIDRELRVVVDHIQEHTLLDRSGDLVAAAIPLAQVFGRSQDLHDLPRHVWLKSSYSPEEQSDFEMRLARQPELVRMLFECGTLSWYFQLDPLDRTNVFTLPEGPCTPGIVAPRSFLIRIDRR